MKKLPNWIAPLLRIAGILHIFTAAGLIFFSEALLSALQAKIPLIPPSDWWIEVSGLVLLIAGTGYFISSFNPLRNSVSLVLGYMSHFLLAIFLLVQLGSLSFQSVITAGSILFMLSWVGFGIYILYQISNTRNTAQTLTHSYSEPLAKTLSRFRTHRGKNLLQLSNQQPVLLVFLRQFDSPLYRQALADIQRKKDMIEGEGTRLVFVHPKEEEKAKVYFEKAGLQEEHRISDPNGIMYNAFGLEKAAFAPKSIWSFRIQHIAALLPIPAAASFMGSSTQMPGIFLINQGEIIKSYRRGQATQKPDYVSLASCEAA